MSRPPSADPVRFSCWIPDVSVRLADHLSDGRFAVNVVSGWFGDEFTAWCS